MIPIPSATDVANPKLLWDNVEEELRKTISIEEVDRWFRRIRVLECRNESVAVGVEDETKRDYIQENYEKVLNEIFSTLMRKSMRVDLRISGPEAALDEPAPSPVPAEPDPSAGAEAAQPVHKPEAASNGNRIVPPVPAAAPPLQFEPINGDYTFNTFVVGSSNKMASAAAEAVADAPFQSYNPLFLYGGVGLGKTHLMQAIGNRVLDRFPGKQVLYLSAEQFVNTFIDSIKRNERLSFQATFRNVDVLLIDDIQFLAGKESTQEEFFHTFNALHNRKKQIVISSDRPPKDIPTIEDRLRSRFEWGLIVDIGPPDFELRMAILRSKCEQMNSSMGDDVLEYIANKIRSSIRELEGALSKLHAHVQYTRDGVNVETASRVLGELYDRPVKEVSIEKIQRKVAEHFNLKLSDILGRKRSRSIAQPRQIAMFMSRKLTRHSYPEIGTFFGNKDHTTVMFACEKIKERMDKDKELRSIVQQLLDSFSTY